MITLARQTWGLSERDFHLEGISPILNWILDNASLLSQHLGRDFIRVPNYEGDHPVMNRGSSRHPFYATMWNTAEKIEHKDKFTLLQAHILYAHTNAMFERNNLDEYENYSGQTEWKGLVNSAYQASLAVRKLSEKNHAEELSSLAVELKPKEFVLSLNEIGHINDIEILERLNSLKIFLQKSLEIRDWRFHQVVNRNGGGGGKRITGYVERENLIGDEDDQDLQWGKQSQISDSSLAPDMLEQLSDLDLSRDEFFDSEDLILSSFEDSQSDLSSYASASAAQLRHIEMANQLFPWSYSYLSINEVAAALNQSSQWVKNTFHHNHAPKQADIDKLESICLMRIMLFTSSSFERARQLIFLSSMLQNEDASLAFFQDQSKKYLLRIRAIQPDYKSVKEAGNGTEKKRSDYFYIQDVANTQHYINLLLKHRPNSNKNNKLNTQQKNHVFKHRPEKLLVNLKLLLSELDVTGRLTITKLSRFMFNRILQATNGDICAASMIAGEEHILAHVRLFYSVMQIKLLEKTYFEETQIVVALLHQAQKRKDFKFDTPTQLNQNRFVGSRLCPTKSAVKEAVTTLHQSIRAAANSKNFIELHNLFTLMTVWQFSFSTACRAIETPYLPLSSIDRQSGIATLSDKDDKKGYKTRLIWLPPSIIAAMEMYEQHRLSVLKKYPNNNIDDYPVFFIKDIKNGQLKVDPVQPKTLVPIMHRFMPYPANFHRRFMRSEMLEHGCPIEIVDGYMGHWHAGEEPWAAYSSFNFLSYQEALNTYLVPIIKEIGLLDISHLKLSVRLKIPTYKGLH